VLGEPGQGPSTEEINNRLNQLLERLLFEATIVDEVRRIGEDILDLELISEKLFSLLSSVIDYMACALVVGQGRHSVLMLELSRSGQEQAVKAYVLRVALQLGLPPFREEVGKAAQVFEHSLTQPIDSAGQRLGLLVVVPWPNQNYKPGDQKVVRLICEQLSTVLRLCLSHMQRESEVVGPAP
jgi:hypothetical protein